MKLLYLYIQDHNCIKDQEFNFDSKYHFHLEKKNSQEWELIEDKPENPLPDEFWTMSKDRKGIVESVSAVVGENGSGKTSLANFLGDYIGYRGEDKKYLIIFKRETDNLPQCWANLNGIKLKANYTIYDIKDNKHPSDKYPPFIYFSPFYTTEHIFHLNNIDLLNSIDSNGTIDISTSSFLTPKNADTKFMQGLAYYKSEEYKSALVFLSKYRKVIKKDKNQKTLPEPKGILITIDVEYALAFLSSLKVNNWNRHVVSVKEREEVTEDQIREELRKSLLKLYYKVKKNIFLLTFWCYVISFWRRYFSPKSRKKMFIISKYISIINEIKLFEDSPQQGYEHILNHINIYDKTAYAFFKLFNNFLTSEKIIVKENNKNIEIECDFSKIDEIKEVISKVEVPTDIPAIAQAREKRRRPSHSQSQDGLDTPNFENDSKDMLFELAYRYNIIPLRTSFIRFGFTPKMSSGEISFLTIFSRIYNCIVNNERIKTNDDLILFFDEVETTLHPEWQRRLVSWIITFLEEFAENKKVHVIFASHSPILLSDIPDSNVVFLKKNKETGYTEVVNPQKRDKTFGANIHTLLAKSFFLNKTIGEFASRYIEEICVEIEAINNISMLTPERLSQINQKINRIAEEFIRIGLQRNLLRKIESFKTHKYKTELKAVLEQFIKNL